MITFLPYFNFTDTAKCLDYKRLGRQRVEAKIILNILNKGGNNHPAVKMWYGYEKALMHYLNVMIEEWIFRGYKNNMIIDTVCDFEDPITTYPPWLGDMKVHSSHRSNLLRKLPEYYNKFGWSEVPTSKYYWPVT